jgi:hypothetical protein
MEEEQTGSLAPSALQRSGASIGEAGRLFDWVDARAKPRQRVFDWLSGILFEKRRPLLQRDQEAILEGLVFGARTFGQPSNEYGC